MIFLTKKTRQIHLLKQDQISFGSHDHKLHQEVLSKKRVMKEPLGEARGQKCFEFSRETIASFLIVLQKDKSTNDFMA